MLMKSQDPCCSYTWSAHRVQTLREYTHVHPYKNGPDLETYSIDVDFFGCKPSVCFLHMLKKCQDPCCSYTCGPHRVQTLREYTHVHPYENLTLIDKSAHAGQGL